MRALLILPICLLLSGCLGDLSSTGPKTTVYYDTDGRQTKATTETVNTSDVATHYQTVAGVAKAVKGAVASQTSAVKAMVADGARRAKTPTEAVLLRVLAIQSVAAIDVGAAMQKAIGAVGERPSTVVESVTGLGRDLAKVGLAGVVGKYTVDGIDAVMGAVGTRVATHITGDGNTSAPEIRDTRTTTTTHANSTGDNSPPSVVNTQTTSGCPTGDCGQDDDAEAATDDETVATCSGERGEVQVISTDADGTRWVASGCSCESYQAEHCNI